ncbi:unnamed protein product, partial [Oikopleura dioica]
PLMQAQARSDFETALHANTSIPNYKKMLLNPADGSLDQKQHHHKGQQRGKGRRQSYSEEGQNKKAKYQDQGKGQNDNGQKSGDRGGHRGGGRGAYRGGGKGRGGYKGQQNFTKGGQKEGQKATFKDKGGVELMSFLNKQELTELWSIAKILTDEDFDEATDEGKVDIFLERLNNRPLQKAYTYEKAKTIILDVIEDELEKPPTAAIKRKVKLWTTRTARASGKETLQFPKQAEYVTDGEMSLIWGELIKSNKDKAIEAAIAFALCYVTGARMGEALALRYEDAELKKDESREFYSFHIRSSKTDPFCKRLECLTLPLTTPHAIPIALRIRSMFDKNKRGFLFPLLKQNTSTATGFIQRYAKKAGIKKEISAHSGRVSFYVEGRRGGQSQDELAHTLRWMPGSTMPSYYERIHRETCASGAPTVVAETRLRKRSKQASASADSEEETPNSSNNASPERQDEGQEKKAIFQTPDSKRARQHAKSASEPHLGEGKKKAKPILTISSEDEENHDPEARSKLRKRKEKISYSEESELDESTDCAQAKKPTKEGKAVAQALTEIKKEP